MGRPITGTAEKTKQIICNYEKKREKRKNVTGIWNETAHSILPNTFFRNGIKVKFEALLLRQLNENQYCRITSLKRRKYDQFCCGQFDEKKTLFMQIRFFFEFISFYLIYYDSVPRYTIQKANSKDI